jgi:hypothetical protein
LAGLALLANRQPARMLALVASVLSVSEIPFGTTLGILYIDRSASTGRAFAAYLFLNEPCIYIGVEHRAQRR